jgi:hypothetical protein
MPNLQGASMARRSFKQHGQSRRMRKQRRLRKLRAACLSIGLATAWGADAKADVTLKLSITPQHTLTNAIVLYANNVSTGIYRSLGTIPAGQTTTFIHTFLTTDSSLASWQPDPNSYTSTPGRPAYYSLIATYQDAPTPGVTISFPNDSPVQNATSWSALFIDPPNYPIYPGHDFSEPNIINDLLTNNPPQLSAGFLYDHNGSPYPPWQGNTIAGTSYGSQGALINFSDPTSGGTIIVEVVPEPASACLLVTGAGIAAISLRRRRET